MTQYGDGGRDDVDRLFARLDREAPPAGFAERVLMRAAARRRASLWRERVLGGCFLALLTLLGALAFQVGETLSLNEVTDLAQAAFSEPQLVADIPDALALSLRESLPWMELMVMALLTVAAVTALRAAVGAGRRGDDMKAA